MKNLQSPQRLTGLIAAVYSPYDDRGELNFDVVKPYTDFLIKRGVSGLFTCGSTGEGVSMTTEERQAVTQAYIEAADGRVPVIAHVGHNCLRDAAQLAAHAAASGALAVSANAPSYFKPGDVDSLVASMAEIAGAAPGIPFYYYHIPVLTGVRTDLCRFLSQGVQIMPNLVGIKFTDPALHEYHACMLLEDGRFDILWGCDEMMLGALATGAKGAVGSTFNVVPEVYLNIIEAFEAGDMDQANAWQQKSIRFVATMARYPFHPGMKVLLREMGFDFGSCRLPQARLTSEQQASLVSSLRGLGLFNDLFTASSPHPAASAVD